MPVLSVKQREALKYWKPKPDPELERERDALTEEDIRRAALDDPDCPPLSPEALKRIINRPGQTPPGFEERSTLFFKPEEAASQSQKCGASSDR